MIAVRRALGLGGPLRRRIVMVIGGVTAVLLLLMAAMLQVSAGIRDDLAEATASFADEQRIANRISNAVMRQLVAASYYPDHPGPQGTDVRSEFEEAGERAYAEIRRYLVRDLTPDERVQLERVKEQHQRLEVAASQAFEFYNRGEIGEAEAAQSAMTDHALALQGAVGDFLRMRERGIDQLRERQAAVFDGLRLGLGGLLFLLILGSVLLGRFLHRRLAVPLTELAGAAHQIGEGDLRVRVSAGSDDEFSEVATSFNRMAERLAETKADLERRNRELRETLEQLHQTQDELVRSEKLGAVGRMMAGLAHELNNPLASVLGYAELLSNRLEQPEDELTPREVREELVDPILAEGTRARELIRNLLRFSRESSAELGPVSLDEVLEVVVALREYAFEQAGVELVVDDVPDCWVVAEKQRLQQVFVNLLNNALEAMAEQGEGTVRIAGRPVDDAVVVLVEDEGPGLVDPGRIFEPFYTTKPEDEGTGLGLALVHQFMEEFGGSVRAENRERGGARFLLRFERTEAAEPEFDEPPEETSEPGGRLPGEVCRVLVVEDEPALRRLQMRMLRRIEADVLLAGSEREARGLLGENEVDVVVSDYKMPGGNGMDLYRWIEREHPSLVERFIFVTGDVESTGLADFAERNPNRVLHKPFRFDDYLERVTALLEPPRGGDR